MSVAVVVGTRPEAIKLKPVIDELKERQIEVFAISSMQHDLSSYGIDFDRECYAFLDPDFRAMPLANRVGRMTSKMAKIFKRHSIQSVIVQGDTATVLAGATAAFIMGIPVVHVEAGLRTDDLKCPFPEEGIRQMVSRIATLNCAPTQKAFDALENECVPGELFLTGNTIVDALNSVSRDKSWPEGWEHSSPAVIVTCHRRENWGKRAEELVEAIKKFGFRTHIVLHPHPKAMKPFVGMHKYHHLHEPISHQEMIRAMSMADLVITDSGGMAEEAAIMGIPTIIYRDRTERMEAVECGVAKLVPDAANIPSLVDKMIEEGRMDGTDAFGDGKAAVKIVDKMIEMRLT